MRSPPSFPELFPFRPLEAPCLQLHFPSPRSRSPSAALCRLQAKPIALAWRPRPSRPQPQPPLHLSAMAYSYPSNTRLILTRSPTWGPLLLPVWPLRSLPLMRILRGAILGVNSGSETETKVCWGPRWPGQGAHGMVCGIGPVGLQLASAPPASASLSIK